MTAPPTWKESNLLPQPAPSLPGHQAPVFPPGTRRFPTPVSKAGGPIGTAVLFEDEEIRLWENKLPPGMDGPKHSHEQDYWICLARSATEKKPTMAASQEHNGWERRIGPQGNPGTVFYVKKTGPESAYVPPKSETIVFFLCELKLDPGSTSPNKPPLGTKPSDPPAGWGASAGIVYENVEMRVWDLRVPPGQTGTVPVEEKNSVFHLDIRGRRAGAVAVDDLLAGGSPGDQEVFLPFPVTPTKEGAPGFSTKKTEPKPAGRTYYRSPAIPETDPSPAVAGVARNDGEVPYRGLVIEVKPGETALTAML